MGLAMNSDENVPVMTPIRSVKAMSLTSPPVTAISVMAVSSVVPPVMIVRDSVRFSERLMMSRSVPVGLSFSSSRIRSNTTMVSLIE
jgi:hypothetical protein